MTRVARAAVGLAFMLSAGQAGLAGQRGRPEIVPVDPLTASISGRVTTETGSPIRRAEIRATSNGGLTRFATTDTDGRYVVRDLPAGAFTLHISKSGFVPLYFGQRRPFERRTTIELIPGRRVSADIRLPRAGAITGRIVDRTGEPVMGARVQAMRRRMIDGQRGLQAVGVADTTDDTGSYRVYGLPPGDYYVAATPRPVEDRTGRPVVDSSFIRATPVFYPGTANRDEAQRITVDVSGEARADLQLYEVRTSRVSGIVLTAAGTPAAGAFVSLLSRDLSIGGSGDVRDVMVPLQIQDDADAQGRFELAGVPPGSFTLRAQTRPRISVPFDPISQRFTAPPAGVAIETGLVPVSVEGDVAGITVTTSPGGSVEVAVVADQGVTASLPDTVRVNVRTADRSDMMTMDHGGAKGVLMLPGPSRVSVDGLPENWALKAVMLDNEDITDRAIEVRDGQPKTMRIVLTDRVTGVLGSVGTGSFANSEATAQAIVLVFPDDEKKWTYPSRFIRSVRAERGRFEVIGLPPNEEYRLVALDYLEDGEEYDSDFLKRMRERAARISLREGEQVAIDLRLVQR